MPARCRMKRKNQEARPVPELESPILGRGRAGTDRRPRCRRMRLARIGTKRVRTRVPSSRESQRGFLGSEPRVVEFVRNKEVLRRRKWESPRPLRRSRTVDTRPSRRQSETRFAVWVARSSLYADAPEYRRTPNFQKTRDTTSMTTASAAAPARCAALSWPTSA